MMSKQSVAYHSSMTRPEEALGVQRTEVGNSVALVADLGHGLPNEFHACDVLYCEPAWQRGYDRFLERAGGGVSFDEYMGAFARIAADSLSGKAPPMILIVGRAALRMLPKPTSQADVNLNTGGRFIAEAVAVSYGRKLPAVKTRHRDWSNIDTENLLRTLAKKYRRVGDPSCGYGNTGRIFAEAGREFVMSDVNATCIGHIAERAGEWHGR